MFYGEANIDKHDATTSFASWLGVLEPNKFPYKVVCMIVFVLWLGSLHTNTDWVGVWASIRASV